MCYMCKANGFPREAPEAPRPEAHLQQDRPESVPSRSSTFPETSEGRSRVALRGTCGALRPAPAGIG